MSAAWPTVASVAADLEDELEDERSDPMAGGPWVDDNPAHRPVLNETGTGWRCTCNQAGGINLGEMRTHADHHPETKIRRS